MLTLQAGYGAQNSSTGGDPLGVVFIGAAGSEAELLNEAYAYEQATKIRDAGPPYMVGTAQFGPVTGAPSMTNQSMWRCVRAAPSTTRTRATRVTSMSCDRQRAPRRRSSATWAARCRPRCR